MVIGIHSGSSNSFFVSPLGYCLVFRELVMGSNVLISQTPTSLIIKHNHAPTLRLPHLADISHQHWRWCTFFQAGVFFNIEIANCWPILANLDYFVANICFFVCFYRRKLCGGVPNLTYIRNVTKSPSLLP